MDTQDDRAFRKAFFRNVSDKPLEPTDPRYVTLYPSAEDPVQLLATAIDYAEGESVQLFSGYRGAGKSTELRRLREYLRREGYLVVLCDFEDYLDMSTAVDISDFLICAAGAFADELVKDDLLDQAERGETYWERFANFLTRTKVEPTELSGEAALGTIGKVGIKANLKNDPSFRRRIQERMAGHIGQLVGDVRAYFEQVLKALRKRHGDDTRVVFMLDSIEHIRGTHVSAEEVQSSVETLFASHSDKLHLPFMHVIYTVPPYLNVRYPSLSTLYAPGGLHWLPALKVKNRTGEPHAPGLEKLALVLKGRGDWMRLLGSREQLDRLSLLSGGHLRDLLRLVAEILRRPGSLPVDEATVTAAINQIRNEFLPIADSDARWLCRIAETGQPSMPDLKDLADFARFLDTALVLSYRNGSFWYDVHPLIREEVCAQGKVAANVVAEAKP